MAFILVGWAVLVSSGALISVDEGGISMAFLFAGALIMFVGVLFGAVIVNLQNQKVEKDDEEED